jgi:hypothetical protein
VQPNTKSAETAAKPRGHRLWMLYLIPKIPHGRWWCALIVFGILWATYWAAGVFDSEVSEATTSPVALFFCVILAYITPVFHYITRRSEEAFDALAPQLALTREALSRFRSGISEKSPLWLLVNTTLGISIWLLQSWLLLGSFAEMMRALTINVVSLVGAIFSLLVWVFLTCAIHALVDNARLFRRLAREVNIDLLNTHALTPFAQMAVSSTLVVIGIQATFPIMWLGGMMDPWTTIPGLIVTTFPLVYLFVAPVWPIHIALREVKRAELARVQEEINSRRQDQPQSSWHTLEAVAPLLTYRREIASVPEWPFDHSIMARFGLYLVIVPLSWIGAALIESLVEPFVGS